MSIQFKHDILSLSNKYASLLVFIPLLLSGLVHFANLTYFPSVHTDEGHYLRRSMILLEEHIPQDKPSRYDHPFFGQVFLAFLFWLIGYPESITENMSTINAASIESLYLVPRTIMAALAAIDTFLIYKISEYRYNRNVALIASLIFAVTPMTWFLNRVLIDNMMLSFLLTSILFAAKYSKYDPNEYFSRIRHKKMLTIMLSGIFFGLSILTKLTAFTMIPAVGFLVFLNVQNSIDNRKTRTFLIWIMPVIALPLIWPIYAAYNDEFHIWIKDTSWQIQRERPLIRALEVDFKADPIVFSIGIAGLAYSALKKDLFLIFWFVVPMVFFYFIGYVATFHLVLFLPALSIASARLLFGIRYPATVNPRIDRVSLFMRVAVVIILGLASTLILENTVGNVNDLYFKTQALVTNEVMRNDTDRISSQTSNLTVIGNQRYFWIPQYVYDTDHHQYLNYFSRSEPLNDNRIIIVDRDMEMFMSRTGVDDIRKQVLKDYINNSKITRIIEPIDNQIYDSAIDRTRFPYTSMLLNNEGTRTELRTN